MEVSFQCLFPKILQNAGKSAPAAAPKKKVEESDDSSSDDSESEEEKVYFVFPFFCVGACCLPIWFFLSSWFLIALLVCQKGVSNATNAGAKKTAKKDESSDSSEDESNEDSSDESDEEPKSKKIKVWTSLPSR